MYLKGFDSAVSRFMQFSTSWEVQGPTFGEGRWGDRQGKERAGRSTGCARALRPPLARELRAATPGERPGTWAGCVAPASKLF